jgi:2-polyprenyl-3-methyl-5-hydroxy-6-metoxy-1,4-benzoquinol methylase
MAHKEQQDFCMGVKSLHANLFKDVNVLDIGSLDINGNNRYLFENYTYTGVDLALGNNVDVVSKGHEFKSDVLYDVVISTECFEHDKMWRETVLNCIKLVKPGGLLLFTCATTGRPEHGTQRSQTNWASPFTTKEWNEEYYQNLTEEDFRKVFNPNEIFSEYGFSVNTVSKDLYFYGIKK